MAYLYGASVQGIQEFIFATNKLREIVGASKIVEKINEKIDTYNPDKVMVKAAGNIKALFYDKKSVEKVVLNFPKEVMQEAYGITISQAVVKCEGETPTQEEINALEQKLKIQRNKPTPSLDRHINILELYSRTARPKVAMGRDKAIAQKNAAYSEFFKKNPKVREYKEISHLSNHKNKIAIIHADGNGLGQLIPKLRDELQMELPEFSKKLDEATKAAYNKAKLDGMKIRDLILSGDDMVVICNADDALTFTKNFLHYFEEESLHRLNYKLTACAGIAFCNDKYPFHYAVSLAEELCSQTKKHAKKINENLAPSSLMFHNIQSSSYQSWDLFVENELTVINDKETVRLDFGPYYLDEPNQPKIDHLIHVIEGYRCDGSPVGKLRNWLDNLHKSSVYARNQLNRINEVAAMSSEWNSTIMNKNLQNLDQHLSNSTLVVKRDGEKKTPLYDVLQILSVTEAQS